MRTDNDTWDITESVGVTAVGVAAIRAVESDRPDALFHDPYARILVRASGLSGWADAFDDESDIDRADVLAAFGGFGGFMVGRTVYFDDYFAAATAAGIRQVVILAAGLDARAYRLAWPAGTVVFELDQPKVLEFKANALAKETPAADRREVPVDLRNDWPTALRAAGFDDSQPTAWLAEGILRYLRAEDQDRLLANIVALSAPGSRVALNSGNGRRREDSGQLREVRQRLLERSGIRAQYDELSYLDEDRSDPAAWFTEHGWTVSTSDQATVLSERGRVVPERDGEQRRRRLITAVR